MDEADRHSLGEMRDHARRAIDWARDGGAAWTADEKTVAAIAHVVAQIGEIARHLPASVKAAYPDIPWAAMSGMRNRIYHEYGRLDIEVLAATVRRDLPALRRALDSALKRR